MTRCEQFEDTVADLDRDEAMSDAMREEALAHAGTCQRCSGSLARARELSAELRALAKSTSVEPRPGVEDALLAALRQRRQVAARAKPAWRIAAAAAAVVLLGVLAAGYFLKPQRSVDSSTGAPMASAERPFIPLGYDEPEADMSSMLVVRVQLNRASLAGLGWPIDAGTSAGLVQAEVILGEDGVARAIRFVE